MVTVIKFWAGLRRNLLTLLTVVSVVAAIVTGVLIRELHQHFHETFTPRTLALVKFVGDLFLQILRSLILPLIVTSLICAIGNLNAKLNKFIGGYGVLYYMVTTVLAIVLGIILAMTIRPGHRYVREDQTISGSGNGSSTVARTSALENLLDLIRNMFPENPVQATMEQYKTVLVAPTDPKLAEDHSQWLPTRTMEKTMNILGIVIMSIFVGVALSIVNSQKLKEAAQRKSRRSSLSTKMLSTDDNNGLAIELSSVTESDKQQPDSHQSANTDVQSIESPLASKSAPSQMIFLAFVNEANEVFMKLVGWVIWTSPVGIYFLILGKMLETDDLMRLLDSLSFYAICVLGGIAIHGLIVLPTIYFLLTRSNPYKMIRGMSQALLMAFGTSSSTATLPVTMACLKQLGRTDKSLRIDERVINFILPIGATINMDGTALYEAVAAIFISQLNNVDMTPLSILTIVLTATLGSVGAAGIPQAGLITLIIVLDTLGLPISDITIIITIDWLLDRFRTVCNVLGDSIGCVIISKRARFDEMEDTLS